MNQQETEEKKIQPKAVKDLQNEKNKEQINDDSNSDTTCKTNNNLNVESIFEKQVLILNKEVPESSKNDVQDMNEKDVKLCASTSELNDVVEKNIAINEESISKTEMQTKNENPDKILKIEPKVVKDLQDEIHVNDEVEFMKDVESLISNDRDISEVVEKNITVNKEGYISKTETQPKNENPDDKVLKIEPKAVKDLQDEKHVNDEVEFMKDLESFISNDRDISESSADGYSQNVDGKMIEDSLNTPRFSPCVILERNETEKLDINDSETLDVTDSVILDTSDSEYIVDDLHQNLPTLSLDSTPDINDHSSCNVPNNFHLPSFQASKPDLDEFLVETKNNLQTPEIKKSDPDCVRVRLEDTSEIVIDDGTGQADNIKNNSESSRDSRRDVYNISIPDSECPGVKRSVLRNLLKERINENKIKSLQKINEEKALKEEHDSFGEKNEFEGTSNKDDDDDDQDDDDDDQDDDDDDQDDDDDDQDDDDDDQDDDDDDQDDDGDDDQDDDDDDDDDQDDDGDDDQDDDDQDDDNNNDDQDDDNNNDDQDDVQDDDELEITSVYVPSSTDDDEDDCIEVIKKRKIPVLEDDDSCMAIYENTVPSDKTELGLQIQDIKSIPYTTGEDCNKLTGVSASSPDSALQKYNDKNGPHRSPVINDDLDETVDLEMNSWIPSFQPGGSYCESKEDEELNSNSNAEDKMMQAHSNLPSGYIKEHLQLLKDDDNSLVYSDISVEEEHKEVTLGDIANTEQNDALIQSNIIESCSPTSKDYGFHYISGKGEPTEVTHIDARSTPNFGFILDDPPISQEENACEIFSSEDLDQFCSGVFKKDTSSQQKTNAEKYEMSASEDESPQESIKDFLDVEAELSGEDDDGVDEDEEMDGDNAENESNLFEDCNLPPSEELRDEISSIHVKKMRDDDSQHLTELKEKFLDDGDLSNDGKRRSKTFAWKTHDTNDEAINMVLSTDSDDDEETSNIMWDPVSKEKVKWYQQNTEDNSHLHVSPKKPSLKINIVGKTELCKDEPSREMWIFTEKKMWFFYEYR